MKTKKKIKVFVLMGGPSAEHEVSLNTGKQILENLDKKKYLAQPVVVAKTGKWLLPSTSGQGLLKSDFNSRQNSTSMVKLDEKSAIGELARDKQPSVAFIAMHGAYGEDGTLQGLLESIGIPYTGSGVLASALGMDKPRSCAIFREAGLNVPDFKVVERKQLKRFKSSRLPLVVKPTNYGSSIGVHIVRNKKELRPSIKDSFKYSDKVIVQKYIKGREITCGVLETGKGKLMALPPMEIIPQKGEFYDYASKYDESGSKHIIAPHDLPLKTIAEIRKSACIAHQVLGCSGMSRSDFILGNDGKLYILEINTIPGMTKTSLLPEAAKATGISFAKLLDLLIQNALSKSDFSS